jgi:TRAP-type transport system small permease protein
MNCMTIQMLCGKLRIFSRMLSHIGNIALAGMMFLTTADVIGRYFFNAPVLGAFEITEYLMLIMIFSFLAFAQSQKAHITVDIFFDRLPCGLGRVINRVNHLVCLAMLLLVTWMGVMQTIDLKKNNEISTLLKLPDYPFAAFLVIGCAALCLEFFIDLIAPESTASFSNE